MPDDSTQPVWNKADVVHYYDHLTGLSPDEMHAFETHLAPGMRILDVGVGGGRTTPYLSSIAGRYVGIDYAEQMVQLCRSKFPDLEFHHQDAADMHLFSDRSFDAVVFSFNGIDYLCPDESRLQCLRECARILKDDGVFIFSSHNARALLVKPHLSDAGFVKRAWRIVRSIYKSARLSCRTLPNSFFWQGRGYLHDPVHGGIRTYAASPGHVVGEVSRFGFTNVEVIGGNYPADTACFATPWYYYVFRKQPAA